MCLPVLSISQPWSRDFKTGKQTSISTGRSICHIGWMPANGMLYTFPTDCQCQPFLRGDMAMAPAADMFELGAKVQVLKRGTMFHSRAAQLHHIYTTCDSLEAIPSSKKARLEKEIFHAPLADIWSETCRFFGHRNPKEIQRAEQDPKYQMALVFRWYLGKTGQWAIDGDPAHRIDYQICCGPAMGAFNSWVKGSFLEPPENRTVVNIALNLLEGAAAVTRAQQLRSYGVSVPESTFYFRPRPLC